MTRNDREPCRIYRIARNAALLAVKARKSKSWRQWKIVDMKPELISPALSLVTKILLRERLRG